MRYYKFWFLIIWLLHIYLEDLSTYIHSHGKKAASTYPPLYIEGIAGALVRESMDNMATFVEISGEPHTSGTDVEAPDPVSPVLSKDDSQLSNPQHSAPRDQFSITVNPVKPSAHDSPAELLPNPQHSTARDNPVSPSAHPIPSVGIDGQLNEATKEKWLFVTTALSFLGVSLTYFGANFRSATGANSLVVEISLSIVCLTFVVLFHKIHQKIMEERRLKRLIQNNGAPQGCSYQLCLLILAVFLTFGVYFLIGLNAARKL